MKKKIYIIFILTILMLFLFNIRLEAATKIVGISTYNGRIDIYRSDCTQDELNENYYSVTYEIVATNCELLSFQIRDIHNFPDGCFSANADTGEEQTVFSDGETKFKIMIPAEAMALDFKGIFAISSTFELETQVTQANGEKIVEVIEQTFNNYTNIDNRHTQLMIISLDADTLEPVKGLEFQATDTVVGSNEGYITGDEGTVLIEKVSEGQTKIIIRGVPEGYTTDSDLYIVDVEYDTYQEYIIYLKSEAEETEENEEEEETENQEGTEEENNQEEQKETGEKDEEIQETEENDQEETEEKAEEEEKQENNNEEAESQETQEQGQTKEETKEIEESENAENLESNKEEAEKIEETEEQENIENQQEQEKISEAIEETKVEEENQTNEETQVEEETSQVEKLPKTGNDYFVLKLILADTFIFTIFLLILLIKHKKTDLKSKTKRP